MRILDGPQPFLADQNPHIIDQMTEIIQEVRPHVLINQSPYLQTGARKGMLSGYLEDDHIQTAFAVERAQYYASTPRHDVAAAKGIEMLTDGYRITRDDLVNALNRQNVELRQGDVVLIRTGRMKLYENASAFMANPPGLGMAAAKFLVEESGAMIVGADNLSFEAFPSEIEGNYVPLHTYLLAQQGVPIIELANLEELSRDQVFEFAFIGGSLKLRGADAAPIRPIAIPVR